MKKIFSILLIVLICSCSDLERPKNSPGCNKWKLTLRHNWADYTFVICDSCQMLSQSEAIVWINGQKTKVFANKILAHFFPCY